MVAVNPEVLIWAREAAALSLEEAAHKLGFKDSSRSTAASKLFSLETGEKEPSRAQLNRMSEKYRQPLLALYLRTPPQKGVRGQDYRTLLQRSSNRLANAYLDVLMRNVKTAQTLVRDLLEEDEMRPLEFVGSVQPALGEDAIANRISDTLNFDLQRFRNKRSYTDAFAYLRDLIEGIGIFVLRASNLGNYHTTIPVEVFRGFVYADSIAPFVVINRNDAKSAYSFTAIHELAHLWIGSSGVSGELSHDSEDIEHFCDRIAAKMLLRPQDFHENAYLQKATHAELVSRVSVLSSNWNVSRTMIAFNLLREDIIDVTRWESLKMQFRQEFLRQKQLEREELNAKENMFFDMNRILRNNLGERLTGLLRASLAEGSISRSKAAIALSIPPRRVEAILNP